MDLKRRLHSIKFSHGWRNFKLLRILKECSSEEDQKNCKARCSEPKVVKAWKNIDIKTTSLKSIMKQKYLKYRNSNKLNFFPKHLCLSKKRKKKSSDFWQHIQREFLQGKLHRQKSLQRHCFHQNKESYWS